VVGSNTSRQVYAGSSYDPPMPRSWAIAMTVLVACLIASIVIALVKLL